MAGGAPDCRDAMRDAIVWYFPADDISGRSPNTGEASDGELPVERDASCAAEAGCSVSCRLEPLDWRELDMVDFSEERSCEDIRILLRELEGGVGD